MSLPGVRRCRIEALPAGWPPLQVWAVFPPRQPSATPAQQRSASQAFARQMLQQLAGAALAAQWPERPPAARGARCWSFSHETEASLLAWCPSGESAGAIGVDLLDLDSLAQTRPSELVDTADLYLGPAWAAELAALSQASDARVRFAQGWTGHEARLKCLGLGLEEWQPSLAQRLLSTEHVSVQVPGEDSCSHMRWVASLAWRPAQSK